MSLLERIDQDVKEAMKAGQKDKLTVLRGLKSDIKYKQIELISESMTDEQVIGVLSTAAKKRRESIEQYRLGKREDLAQKEEFELGVITEYLPQQLSEARLRELIQEAISETGADSPQKMGLVMKALMPKVKGQADGKLVSRLVSEFLAK
ncbi:MAG: GatB/YqeY domain-containing protein [Candidatus Zixiibacteriota bacterium]